MTTSPNTIRDAVRNHYADLARSSSSCCGSGDCCDSSDALYNVALLADLPAEVSGFSLGCGDPITLAGLRPGETVLDLGSGGGLDCFLAARQVGPEGRVIGVDMTTEMLERARAAAERLGAANVEFRQGYLEALPVEDNSIDVVISNCVINLSPDKPQVLQEVYRVLTPGGRMSVSDIVSNGALPESVSQSMAAWGACIAGALDVKDYERGLSEAGFTSICIEAKEGADAALARLPIGVPFSASITAVKSSSLTSLSLHEEGMGVRAMDAAIFCSAPGGMESRRDDVDQLMSRVAEVRVIADGYEFHLAGDPAETRALAEAFIQAEAACCSFLKFELGEAGNGMVLRLTGSKEAIRFAEATGIAAPTGETEAA